MDTFPRVSRIPGFPRFLRADAEPARYGARADAEHARYGARRALRHPGAPV